ncbi:hypothetical protein Pelo_3023 [Pelomyxa schiedti]|nr:hypothetical protein Pelo_3023 [Pelomyxa schiedti]
MLGKLRKASFSHSTNNLKLMNGYNRLVVCLVVLVVCAKVSNSTLYAVSYNGTAGGYALHTVSPATCQMSMVGTTAISTVATGASVTVDPASRSLFALIPRGGETYILKVDIGSGALKATWYGFFDMFSMLEWDAALNQLLNIGRLVNDNKCALSRVWMSDGSTNIMAEYRTLNMSRPISSFVRTVYKNVNWGYMYSTSDTGGVPPQWMIVQLDDYGAELGVTEDASPGLLTLDFDLVTLVLWGFSKGNCTSNYQLWVFSLYDQMIYKTTFNLPEGSFNSASTLDDKSRLLTASYRTVNGTNLLVSMNIDTLSLSTCQTQEEIFSIVYVEE